MAIINGWKINSITANYAHANYVSVFLMHIKYLGYKILRDLKQKVPRSVYPDKFEKSRIIVLLVALYASKSDPFCLDYINYKIS